MRRDGNIVSYTAEEIDARIDRGESQTDWARVDAMTEEEIEAVVDVEEEGDFDGAVAYAGLPSWLPGTTLRLDDDVVAWFKARGDGYLSRVNRALRDHIAAVERAEAEQARIEEIGTVVHVEKRKSA